MRRLLLAILALAAFCAPSYADAPAPAASPKPKPTPAATTITAEPFDLAPVDAPGEPQPDSPSASPSPAPVAVPVFEGIDDPARNPCGVAGDERWCTQIDTGYVTVDTRGEKREYVTGGLALTGPVRGIGVLFLRGEVYGVQDGGRLALNPFDPQSFRAVVVEAALGRTLYGGKLGLSIRSGTTFSIEGGRAAPIDPRLWTARAEVSGKLKIANIRLRGGHEGTVGGWALGGDLEVPIPNAPALVTSYDYPLTRQGSAAAPLPWVVTLGARATFGKFRLSSLFQ